MRVSRVLGSFGVACALSAIVSGVSNVRVDKDSFVAGVFVILCWGLAVSAGISLASEGDFSTVESVNLGCARRREFCSSAAPGGREIRDTKWYERCSLDESFDDIATGLQWG